MGSEVCSSVPVEPFDLDPIRKFALRAYSIEDGFAHFEWNCGKDIGPKWVTMSGVFILLPRFVIVRDIEAGEITPKEKGAYFLLMSPKVW